MQPLRLGRGQAYKALRKPRCHFTLNHQSPKTSLHILLPRHLAGLHLAREATNRTTGLSDWKVQSPKAFN